MKALMTAGCLAWAGSFLAAGEPGRALPWLAMGAVWAFMPQSGVQGLRGLALGLCRLPGVLLARLLRPAAFRAAGGWAGYRDRLLRAMGFDLAEDLEG